MGKGVCGFGVEELRRYGGCSGKGEWRGLRLL